MPERLINLLVFTLPVFVGCAAPHPPLDVVEFVDLNRYVGRWYEIANYPAPFQAGCTGTMAEYILQNDGMIKVVNSCHDESLNGPLRQVKGTARVVDSGTNVKLKVCFFWPFEGDYWIIDLGSDYEYAVIGVPNRRFLWILSRTPTIGGDVYQQIVGRLPAKGYDPSKLVRTVQPGNKTEF
ncbi:MAG: lipocalin family protein [Planctomycetota bacterium]|jgi:apolipoprotein D and lipocalin family protein